MSDNEISVVVDENDNVIEYKLRLQLLPTERIRIIAVWIENSQGHVLIAQRALSMKMDPGCWGPAAAGTVEKGQSYENCALKELEEELGIKFVTLNAFQKQIYVSTRGHKRVCQWFKLIWDHPVTELKLHPDEVEAAKWIEKSDLARETQVNPDSFVGSASMWPELFKLI
ncbi:MAG: NUDIX domain-containing protein [Patescibacteria group bacterium]